MIYKALFDTKSPTWQAYGRAVFFDSDDDNPLELARLAIVEAQKDYPGSEIYVAGIGSSTENARKAFHELKRRAKEWQDRVAAGIPNKPSDMLSSHPSRGMFWFLSDKVAKLFAELERRPSILEDRREYCIDDLRQAYSLSEEDAAALYLRIRHVFKP